MSILETTESFEKTLETVEPKNFLETLYGMNEAETAPSMEIQTREISETFFEIPKLHYEIWKDLSLKDRIEIMNKFEKVFSKI